MGKKNKVARSDSGTPPPQPAPQQEEIPVSDAPLPL